MALDISHYYTSKRILGVGELANLMNRTPSTYKASIYDERDQEINPPLAQWVPICTYVASSKNAGLTSLTNFMADIRFYSISNQQVFSLYTINLGKRDTIWVYMPGGIECMRFDITVYSDDDFYADNGGQGYTNVIALKNMKCFTDDSTPGVLYANKYESTVNSSKGVPISSTAADEVNAKCYAYRATACKPNTSKIIACSCGERPVPITGISLVSIANVG